MEQLMSSPQKLRSYHLPKVHNTVMLKYWYYTYAIRAMQINDTTHAVLYFE